MTDATELDPIEIQLAHLRERLTGDFGDRYPREIVESYVDDAVLDLRDARVRTFVPVLVESSVRNRLRFASE